MLPRKTYGLKLKNQPIRSWCFLPILSLAIVGCSTGGVSTEDSVASTETSPKLKIVSTFVPMTSFAKAVAGDRATVVQLLPNNVSPHDYQARPEDVVKLTQADVVIENGLEFEPFLESMIQASENQDVLVIDSSETVTLLNSIEGEDTHEHDDHEEGHKEDESTGAKTEAKDHHNHGTHDPHIWLDPKRAIQQVENIKAGLMKADPQGKEIYQANAQAYIEKLQTLDADIARQLQPYQGKTFVTYHDFASYFAQSYGLEAEYLVGIPSENATPADVTRVMQAVKQSNLKTLLTEPQITGNPFAALAQDLDVNVSVFNPLDTYDEASIEAETYLDTMEQNVSNLTTAFSGQEKQAYQFKLLNFSRNFFNPQLALLNR